MRFKILFITLFCGVFSWGQIAAWDFNGVGSTTLPTQAATIFNANLDASNTITRGATAAWSVASNSFRTIGFKNEGIATTNTDYFQITLSSSIGFSLSLSTIDAKFAGTASFAATPGVSSQFAYSLDGITFTLISTPQITIGTPATLTQINLSGIPALQNLPDTATVTLRYYASGQTTTGGWGFNSPLAGNYGLAIGGTIIPACTPPANPIGVISGNTPACNTTSLSYSGTATAPIVNYWQTTSSGTSTTNNAATPLTITTPGNYYVRAFDSTSGSTGCWSNTAVGPFTVLINTPPTITTNPSNSVISDTGNTTFTTVASGTGLTYQWQVNTGTGFINLSNIAPYSNVNTATLSITAATLSMNGYQYQCVVSGLVPCTSVTSFPATLVVTNLNPNNALNTVACYGSSSVVLSWTAATVSAGTLPDGYMVFAIQGAIAPASALQYDAATYSPNSDFSLATLTTPITLGKCVYNGTALTATITGLTSGANYSFTVIAYKGVTQTGWATGINLLGSWNVTNASINVPNITTLAATIDNAQSAISWNRPTPLSCYDEYLVVANQGAVVFTPSGNGSSYIANSVYSSANQVVYKGTGNNFQVTGLTNYLSYCYKVFVRRGTEWSSGVSVCQTPILAYCTSAGSTLFNTSITNVTLNTINNSSAKPAGYTDYTASQSTNLQRGANYSLSVKLNTDGTNTILAYAWIDYNQDGDFLDAGEALDLGQATNTLNGLTNVSPLSITIPLTATLGGTRMRVIATYNNDSSACLSGFDGEVEDYAIVITAACLPTTAISSFAPTSGPAGTEVTITGSGFTSATSVTFNGNPAAVTFVSSTALIAIVPTGVTTGVLTVTEGSCSVKSATNFTQLSTSGVCVTGTSLTSLIISEVYSSLVGKSFYVELYNPTGNTIDLDALGADYKLVRYGDIGQTNGIHSINISGIIPPGGVYLADLGVDSICGALGFQYANKLFTLNENDEIRLTKNDVLLDIVNCPNELGYSVKRNVSAAGPSTSFIASDWTTTSNETCTNLGSVPFGYNSVTPTITGNPSDSYICGTTASFTASASALSGTLSYQWYFNDTVATGWTAINSSSLSGITISGETTTTLNLLGNLNLYTNYQFYCKVTVNGTCSSSSDAAQLKVNSTIWNGTVWSNGTPSANTQAVFAGNYSSTADLVACSLLVNSGIVTVNSNHNFVITNAVVVLGGSLVFENNASLVQINNVINTGSITYKRNTTPMRKYDYTYWSSPVFGQTLQGFSPLTLSDKYFKFDPTIGNWSAVSASATMDVGLGYIVRAPQNFDTVTTTSYNAAFSGTPNNGTLTTPITVATTDYNLIGNPYPSALSADLFLSDTSNTSVLDGTIYLWTHNTVITNQQYTDNDYAVYNYLGGIGTISAPNIGVNNTSPNGKIASGQSFFIRGLASGTATFTNSMRLQGNNNQFFKMNSIVNSINEGIEKHRIWLGVTDTRGNYKQTLVGYATSATDNIDRGYDGQLMDETPVCIYSLSGNTTLSIQGRALPFQVTDEVSIGFHADTAGTFTINLASFDGLFSSQDIYLKDMQENVVYDLKQGDYSFISNAGTFNNRFILVYIKNTILHANTAAFSSSSIVLYQPNQDLFIDAGTTVIQKVRILDVQGRLLLEKEAINDVKTTINIGKTNQILLVEITSKEGEIVTKKYLN